CARSSRYSALDYW
nr:immunoglobulin heavy chain junction region [Mus musculus]